jgi:beta-lactamase superfamily II metal-dependent hydrolase
MPADAIRIRMYRVGFGDCFLVTLPTSGEETHILVDCGAHPSAAIKDLDAVVNDIKETTGNRLALVVASHEHADHISGFGKCDGLFATFEVGEIWMPWAMDPDDLAAAASRRRRLALALQLQAHFRAKPGSGAAEDAVLNVVSNERSMAALRSGFRGNARVRYLRSPRRITKAAKVVGLTVQVVGPPGDEDYLKKMDPPAHERFFKLDDSMEQVVVKEIRPFRADWKQKNVAAARKGAGWSAGDERDLGRLAERSLDHLAFALDHAVNNTSLALIFSFRGKRLLFPGDAQYGNWKAWLDRPTALEELGEVSFLKVAHHGSENATPKSALNAMTAEGLAAMVSTQVKPWPSIPQAGIMTALEKRTGGRVVRSDALKRPPLVDGDVQGNLPANFQRNKLSIDYTLPV